MTATANWRGNGLIGMDNITVLLLQKCHTDGVLRRNGILAEGLKISALALGILNWGQLGDSMGKVGISMWSMCG